MQMSAVSRTGLYLWCLSLAACGGGGSPTSSSGSGGNTGSGPTLNEVRLTRTDCSEPCQPAFPGDHAQLKAEAVYSDGSTTDVSSRSAWSSNNPDRAVVDSSGRVTTIAVGEVEIAAKFEGTTGRYSLEVAHYVTASITLLRFECIADCEDFTQGEGDFTYSGTIRTGVGPAIGPKQDTVVRLASGESRTINARYDVAVLDQPGQELSIEFCATEWDASLTGRNPDGRMNNLCRTAHYRRGTGEGIPEGANYITLGSGACVVRLHYFISDVAGH
jgi:hypothetical protein